MPLKPGQTLLHYRLDAKIGAGGMGEVWRATDTSLGRQVAIKILPEAFARDADRLARFQREARTLAALDHPNIATVHGLHEADGVHFLAMELAGGEDLAARLSRGRPPQEEALGIALQVAEALEAAHESGVIHRDLKPANIQVDADTRVKVLDFGLAKAVSPETGPQAGDPSESPTVTSLGTVAGVILGTAAYMSPEQAKGRPVDRRADIWAFGCVLLEMLTGKRTFHGDSVAETLAAVMKDAPQWDDLPADTPASVRQLLRRCLVRDPRQRLRDVGDARIVLAEWLSGEAEEPGPTEVAARPESPAWKRLLPWGLTAALALALLGGWVLRRGSPDATGSPAKDASIRLSILLPEDHPLTLLNWHLEVMPALALAPAGDRLVYVTQDRAAATRGEAASVLMLRDRNGFDVKPLRGTEGGEQPFFSPDGSWVGFFTGDSLAKAPAGGGARVKLADGIGTGNGASWTRDGTVVFAHSYVGPLWTVPDSGGEPRPLTTLAEGEVSHRFPQVLPDGRSVLFTVKPSGIFSFDEARIAVADLATGEHRVLLEGGAFARYVDSGHVIYARDGGLLAAPFDLDRLEVTGGAVPVLDGLLTYPITGAALVAYGRDGTLVYVPGDYDAGPTSLVAVDRETGDRRPLPVGQQVAFPRLSPDGRRLVMHGSAANDVVLLMDLERESVTRMTDGRANDFLPIWSHDGKRILFASGRSGGWQAVSIGADGGGTEVVVGDLDRTQVPESTSLDGTRLALTVGTASARDIWILDTARGATPEPYLATRHGEFAPALSPDGNWIAYNSDETGVTEVYLGSYREPERRIQVSTGGGLQPRWRRDGGELYYETASAIVAVPVTWSPDPRPGRPQPILDIHAAPPLGFDVSADGRLFYLIEVDEKGFKSRRLDVVLGWFDELERMSR